MGPGEAVSQHHLNVAAAIDDRNGDLKTPLAACGEGTLGVFRRRFQGQGLEGNQGAFLGLDGRRLCRQDSAGSQIAA